MKGIYIFIPTSIVSNRRYSALLICMSQRSHGLFVGRTRQLARHHKPSKLSINRFIKNFNINDRVIIIQKGNMRNIPHPRYKGRVGTVIEKPLTG